jgi:hypothetical protein
MGSLGPMFPVGTCDTATADGHWRVHSNVYAVNQWLWQFGRGKQLLGGLSVWTTDDRKEAAMKERSLHGAETRAVTVTGVSRLIWNPYEVTLRYIVGTYHVYSMYM